MIKINLLPVRQIRRRKETQQHILLYLIVVGALATLLTIYAGIVTATISGMKKKNAELQTKKDSYRTLLAEIDQFKKDKEILEKKLKIIDNLKKGTQVAVRVLDELANQLPANRIWLKDMKYSTGVLMVKGIALDNATISQFMLAMDAAPYFSNAELESSTQTTVAGNKLQAFSVRFSVIAPHQEPAAATGPLPPGQRR